MTILAAIIFLAWVWSLGRVLTNLYFIPRLRPVAPAPGPLISIVIPARNEARAIERTVRAFLTQSWQSLEVIVVNDRSTDETGSILAGIDDPRLTVINGSETPEGWLGKPWALQQGGARATGELILFVDADVYYGPEALAAAARFLLGSNASLVTLFPNFEMAGFWENVAIPQLALGAFLFMPVWLSNRSTRPSLAIGGGTGNLVRRDAWETVGGHTQLRDAVIDDIGLSRLFRGSGFRTLFVRADTLVSLRMYHGGREIMEGFTKNVFIAFGRSYAITIVLLAFTLLINLGPFFLLLDPRTRVLACLSLLLITLSRVVLFRALRYSLANALFLHVPFTCYTVAVFVRSMWYTGIRNRLVWRGRTYDSRATSFGGKR